MQFNSFLMKPKSNFSAIITPVWLILWSILLSISWLLPVNFPPWATFPADTWIALLLGLIALAVIFRTRGLVNWYGVSSLVILLVFLPFTQFFLGLIPYLGQAWISSTYLLGFLLALLVGARWEAHDSYQLAHALFTAIGIAAVISVGLQLYTWLGLWNSGVLGIWALAPTTSSRPSANLGQPNQLATLLIWGLFACIWAYLHRMLGWASALVVAAFLLLGLALTQSRSGFVAITVMLFVVWMWRKLWPSRKFPWAISGLYIYFLTSPFILRWLSNFLLLENNNIFNRLQQSKEIRLNAWYLFIQAILERPWLGYGWTEVSSAQIAVAERLPSLGGVFTYSHNLFIDLILWNGLPIGLLATVWIIRWFWLRSHAVCQPKDAVLLMFLGSLGIHALLEFPLHYGYFLLPAGLVMGLLDVRLGSRVVLATPRCMLSGLCLAAMLMLGVTIRDYARVDSSYSLLRLEQSPLGEGRGPMGGPPDIWVLTQLREWITLTRYKIQPGMNRREIDALIKMTSAYPSLSFAYRLATALALNGRENEARIWLSKICKITDENGCLLAQRSWKQDSKKDLRIAAIAWPS